MRNIVLEFPDEIPLEKQSVELVERKGIGHPDSICDGIAESISRALSKEYMQRHNEILHHNTDQVELVGGGAKPEFGGGEITRPMYILLSGRATTLIEGNEIPVGTIAIEAAKKYIGENFPNIDVNSHVEIEEKLGHGSSDLRHVFAQKGVPNSNDTSFGVSFAPLSLTEKLVLESEKYITGKMGMKEVGQDIKVMGVRNNDKITLTIAAAMVSKYLDDLDHYKSAIGDMNTKLKDFIAGITDKDVEIHINTGDDYEKGSLFLTVTGTSAEHGDDGSVGRGNRANGLITPYRPMSMEATAGKNPVNHVGKLYNILSNKIAQEIAGEGAEQVYVRLMSQIGKPIDQPLMASVQVIGDKSIENKAREITDRWLEKVTDVTQMCLDGVVCTF